MDYIAANLPAINVEDTYDFYRMLGFQCLHQSKEWLILNRDRLSLEFFHHPELEPETSWHSACIRVQDLAALYHAWQGLNWSAFAPARITAIEHLAEIDMFCVIDINGSLLRYIQQH